MKKAKKIRLSGDWWLVLAVLAIAAGVLVGLWAFAAPGGEVMVMVDGHELMTLPLHTDATVPIPGVNGENTLVIRDGGAKMVAACCPDKLCVSHGAIYRAGESIICLPNRIAITVVGGTRALDGEV